MNTLFLIGGGLPQPYEAPLTYLLLAIIVVTSYRYMEDIGGRERLLLYPYDMFRHKEWYRFFSSGFVHGSWMHLLFNGYALLLFGSILEMTFILPGLFGPLVGRLVYLALIVSGLPMASLYSYYKNKDNPHYRALGASGTISGLVFAYILLYPTVPLYLMFVPIPIPGFIFGILYLVISAYLDKRGGGRIAHDAHYWGSVWGVVFMAMAKPSLIWGFIRQIQHYMSSFF